MATMTLTAPAARRTAQRQARPAAPARAARDLTTPTLVLERRAAPAPVAVRLTPRGRRLARTVVIALALLVALTVSVLGRGAPSQAGDSPARPATATVIVAPGESLWDVARGRSLDSDLRETVARIQELNGLSGGAASTIRPGQELIVPAVA
jgi:nucleoid-associated protein YgaU